MRSVKKELNTIFAESPVHIGRSMRVLIGTLFANPPVSFSWSGPSGDTGYDPAVLKGGYHKILCFDGRMLWTL